MSMLCPLFCSLNASWLTYNFFFTAQEILEHKEKSDLICSLMTSEKKHVLQNNVSLKLV